MTQFEDFNLHQNSLETIRRLGFTEPTTIQEQAIPEIKKGRDVVGQSVTGSGKTAALCIPIVEAIHPGKGVQALILTPTRELCVQVKDTFLTFGQPYRIFTTAIFGGVGIEPQVDNLRRADVVVATPGRLLDHIRRRSVNFSNTHILVLDEVDKMFEMGFIEDVEQIITMLPRQRQTLFFSATIPARLKDLIRQHMHNPASLKAQILVDKSQLRQSFYNVDQHEKFSLLMHLIRKHVQGISLVFCATRHQADMVARNLQQQGIKTLAIHGGLTQNRRLYALESLKNEHIQVLVATDVAARGLDIKNVTHIYNYDVPKTSEEYIHRIGRTARAGKSGEAITLLSSRDYDNFSAVRRDRELIIEQQPLPHFQRIPFQRPSQPGHRPFRPGHGRFQERQGHHRSSFSDHAAPRHGQGRRGSRHRHDSYKPPRFGS